MRLLLACTGLFLAFAGSGCTDSQPAPVRIERLDKTLFADTTRAGVQAFVRQNPVIADLYFGREDYPSPDALTDELHRLVNDPNLNLLHRQAEAEFVDIETVGGLAGQLAEGFANIQKAFPAFKPPRVVTVISGFTGADLLVTDSLIVIGLDYFAGPGTKFRPRGPAFPQYLLRRYQQAFIVPAIVQTIATRFNRTNPTDQTLLADMVFYGKNYVFTKNMLPTVPDSLITGYTELQLTRTYEAQDLVWAHIIDNQLLYQTKPDLKKRYIDERPFTAEVGPDCPGAIGRWVGWQIVARYQDRNPSVSLADLMSNPDARRIFEQSGYKGQPE
jgi:hypothetical protein